MHPRFLLYAYLGPEFQSVINRRTVRGATVDRIPLNELGEWLIRVPDLATQYAIAEVLGALDDKITHNMRISTLLEQRLAALFDACGFDEFDEEVVRLEEIIELNPARPKPEANGAAYIDMAALPTASALVALVAHRAPKSGARFINGDTLMARITPCLENGKTAYVDFLPEGKTGVGSTEFIVMRPRAGISPQYAYFLARSPRFRDFAVRHMSGSSGRQRCSADSLARYELRRPRRREIARFSQQVEPSFVLMRAKLNETLRLGELREALLPRLLSGELRIHEPEVQVEEAM